MNKIHLDILVKELGLKSQIESFQLDEIYEAALTELDNPEQNPLVIHFSQSENEQFVFPSLFTKIQGFGYQTSLAQVGENAHSIYTHALS